jgi:E3 ubiquitin-protein ligase RNF14
MDEMEDERAIELSSVAAIFPEIEIQPGSLFRASLNIPVAPSVPVKAHFISHAAQTALPTPPTSVANDDSENTNDVELDGTSDVHHLEYLPSLRLEIELPEGYPAEKPPKFGITTFANWLPEEILYNLLIDGVRLWEEFGREMMVYSYIDHLQQRAEDVFGLRPSPDDTLSFPDDIKLPLLNFDQAAQREKFERETFVCGICLEPKKGVTCHRLLLCSHVFCVKCLQDFFGSCIKEGNIAGVKCAAPGCGKQSASVTSTAVQGMMARRKKHDRTLSPSELLQIPLDPQVVQRYALLKRKNILESDKSTIYCPRKWCQGAARSKKHPKPADLILDAPEASDGEEGDESQQPLDPLATEEKLPPVAQRLAICEDCDYAFCSVCKRGWHGELFNCYPRRQVELTAEEKASVDFLEYHTTPCPSCNARCMKTHGCNHMICFKCNTHFCYLCSSWLFPAQPYAHFNNKSSPCHMRLWEGEAGDGGAWEPTDDED